MCCAERLITATRNVPSRASKMQHRIKMLSHTTIGIRAETTWSIMEFKAPLEVKELGINVGFKKFAVIKQINILWAESQHQNYFQENGWTLNYFFIANGQTEHSLGRSVSHHAENLHRNHRQESIHAGICACWTKGRTKQRNEESRSHTDMRTPHSTKLNTH